MTFHLAPITEADVRQILTWRYGEPYAIYNLVSSDEAADLRYFLDPLNQFHSVYDSTGDLIGFCSFGVDAQVPGGDYSLEALDIGLGMRPDLTGQGLGSGFLGAILEFARRAFGPTCFRATVASFNGRSRRIFEKQGFQLVQSFWSHSDPSRQFDLLLRCE
jgi:[ribosomal protein S18]-alanine N-acetyltransferase